MRYSLLPLLAAALLVPSLKVDAAVLPTYSEDRFDGSPYTAGAPLVTGTGQIDHGYWQTNHGGSGASIITDDSSLSPSNALALTTGSQDPDGPNNQAQVIMRLAADGANASRPTEAMQIRFAFSMKDESFHSTFYLSGTGGHSALITLGPTVRVHASDGSSDLYTGLVANEWYIIELDMPDLTSGTGQQYTVRIYDSSSEAALGSTTQLLASTNPGNYEFFTFYHTGTADRALYLDNISAVAIPEPGAAAMLLLGASFGVIGRFYYR